MGSSDGSLQQERKQLRMLRQLRLTCSVKAQPVKVLAPTAPVQVALSSSQKHETLHIAIACLGANTSWDMTSLLITSTTATLSQRNNILLLAK